MTFRRKVVRGYKDHHWSTQWNVLFTCGHWGYAGNVTREGMRGHMATTGRCYRCKRGDPPVTIVTI